MVLRRRVDDCSRTVHVVFEYIIGIDVVAVVEYYMYTRSPYAGGRSDQLMLVLRANDC